MKHRLFLFIFLLSLFSNFNGLLAATVGTSPTSPSSGTLTKAPLDSSDEDSSFYETDAGLIDGLITIDDLMGFENKTDLIADYDPINDKVNVTFTPLRGYMNYEIRLYKGSSLVSSKSAFKAGGASFNGSLFTAENSYVFRLYGSGLSSTSSKYLARDGYAHYPVPTLTNVTDNESVNDAGLWFFTQDDGDSELAVSAEQGGEILMGRLDPNDVSSGVTWTTVVSSSDVDGEHIADHWHVYAHGYHWIAFSLTSASKSYLVRTDSNFNVVDMQVIADNEALSTTMTMPTNDMFMVEEASGIAVAHFYPGVGHRLFHYDTSANLTGTTDIGGGSYVHANCSSAIPTDDGFTLLGSEYIGNIEGGVNLIEFDSSWNPTDVTDLLDEADTNIAFSTGAYYHGYLIVHAREVYDVSTLSGPDDGEGHIVRYVFSDELELLSEEVIDDSENLHRPHTTIIGDTLYLTYDSAGEIFFRADELSF